MIETHKALKMGKGRMHFWQKKAFVKNMTWMKVIFQSVALAFLHDTARVFV